MHLIALSAGHGPQKLRVLLTFGEHVYSPRTLVVDKLFLEPSQ